MQRLWSDTHIALMTSDSVFEQTIREALPSSYQISTISPSNPELVSKQVTSEALILWDLATAPEPVLNGFLAEHSNVSRNCSLLLAIDQAQVPHIQEILKKGSADFIVKSATPQEIQIRIRMASRPWVRSLETTFEFLATLKVDLTITEQKLLLCFLRSPDFSAGRKVIMDFVWGESNVHPNTLDVHLFNIRKKLEPSGIRITFKNARACWVFSTEAIESTQTSKTSSKKKSGGAQDGFNTRGN